MQAVTQMPRWRAQEWFVLPIGLKRRIRHFHDSSFEIKGKDWDFIKSKLFRKRNSINFQSFNLSYSISYNFLKTDRGLIVVARGEHFSGWGFLAANEKHWMSIKWIVPKCFYLAVSLQSVYFENLVSLKPYYPTLSYFLGHLVCTD